MREEDDSSEDGVDECKDQVEAKALLVLSQRAEDEGRKGERHSYEQGPQHPSAGLHLALVGICIS